jgi:hypothetical protein
MGLDGTLSGLARFTALDPDLLAGVRFWFSTELRWAELLGIYAHLG